MPDDNNLYLALGRLEGMMQAVLTNQSSHSERMDAAEKRLASLENWRAYTVGLSAAASFGALIVARLLGLE